MTVPPARPLRALPVRSRLPHGPTIVTAAVAGEATAVYLRLAAGAIDERDGEHGAAHFLEHMLFKGTPTRGIGEAALAIEALGGDLNAFTSHDELVLHAEVAGGAWALALDVLVDMVRNPHLDPAEVVRERDVILEEIASYDDDPEEQLSNAVLAALWGDHPYGRQVVGTEASVRGLDADALRAFYARELTAERVTLLVVGDVTHEDVVAHATPRFADWPTGAGRTADVAPVVVAQAARIVRPEGTFDDRQVQLAWPGPSDPAHPDLPALSVLVGILGTAAGDRIGQALDDDPKVGFDAWADVYVGAFGTNLAVGFRPLPGATLPALERALDVLDRISRACRGRWCARSRQTELADLDFGEQTVDGIADDLRHHEGLHGDAAHRAAWREALATVTPDDVARVARRWLRPSTMVVGLLDPDTSDRALQAALDARQARVPTAATARGPRILRAEIGGMEVLLAPADVPVAAVRVLSPGGALRVPERHAGLGTAWSQCLHRGAGPYDGDAFCDALDDLAAEAQATEGSASLSIAATAPATHTADLLELVGELVLDPHFEDEEWANVREELLDTVRSRLDRPRQVVADRIMALRFPNHPWRLSPDGTTASLGRIDGRALERFHRQHFVRGRTVVAVAGGIDPEDAVAALAWLDDLEAPGRGDVVPAPPAWPALAPGVHEVRAGTRQAIVTLVGDGVPLEAPERRGLELAEALLDGQAGRLFLALREEQALAYDLWVRHDARAGGGMFQVGLACDPSRVEAAATGLREVVASLVTHPPTEADLDRARTMLLGREVLADQRVETRAGRLAYAAFLGRPLDPAVRRAQLAATTVADVVAEVRRLLDTGWLEVRSLPRSDR